MRVFSGLIMLAAWTKSRFPCFLLISMVWDISSSICFFSLQVGGLCKFYANAGGKQPIQLTATAIPFIYSFSGNCAASAPISTFICMWVIYIFPVSVHICPPAEKADPSWEYVIRWQTHECGNWDWGPNIPFLGIFVSNFRHFVFAVRQSLLVTIQAASQSIFINEQLLHLWLAGRTKISS